MSVSRRSLLSCALPALVLAAVAGGPAAADTATATLLDETADESASPGERASELVLLAVEAVDKLEYQGALDLLETALECAPGDPRLERSIARLRELV